MKQSEKLKNDADVTLIVLWYTKYFAFDIPLKKLKICIKLIFYSHELYR